MTPTGVLHSAPTLPSYVPPRAPQPPLSFRPQGPIALELSHIFDPVAIHELMFWQAGASPPQPNPRTHALTAQPRTVSTHLPTAASPHTRAPSYYLLLLTTARSYSLLLTTRFTTSLSAHSHAPPRTATTYSTPLTATQCHPVPPTTTHYHPLPPTATTHSTPLNTTQLHSTPPTATHCHPLPPTATHCHPLPPTATHYHSTPLNTTHYHPLPPTATHCHPLPPTTPDSSPITSRRRRSAPTWRRWRCQRSLDYWWSGAGGWMSMEERSTIGWRLRNFGTTSWFGTLNTSSAGGKWRCSISVRGQWAVSSEQWAVSSETVSSEKVKQ